MNETYVEWLVKKKTPLFLTFLRYLFTILAAIAIFLGLMSFNIIIFIVGVLLGVAAYFTHMNSEIEYEYLYVDKELAIDKVLAKSKRKKLSRFELSKMEIVAPMKSHRLDSYKGRNYKTVDYSSHEEKQPEMRYVFYYEGQQMVIFEPNEELVKAMQFAAPRKVFMD